MRRRIAFGSGGRRTAALPLPKGVAHHQEGHVRLLGVLQDLVGFLLHQISLGQRQLLPVKLLLTSQRNRCPLAC